MDPFTICACFSLVVIALLVLFYCVSVFNGLVELQNNVGKAWANIDVVLKQRSDLIPNLVEIVKGYMKYEKSVLEEITRLRGEMMSAIGPAEKAAASDALTSSLKSLFISVENYPKLQASQNFLELQKQITAMENQIADRREFYNNSVLLFNTRIKSLPDMLVAIPLGMREKEYFKASEGEKENVKMDLGK